MTSVYVISAGPLAQKIGIANDPKQRLAGLQTGHPRLLTLWASLEVANPRDVESTAHRLLAKERIRGEWFAVSKEHAFAAIEEAAASLQEQRRAEIEPVSELLNDGWILVMDADHSMAIREQNAIACRVMLPKPLGHEVDTL